MSDANKDVVRRFYLELVGQGRIELTDHLFAAGHVEHTLASKSLLSLAWLNASALAFRNRIVVLDGLYAEGDLVRCKWSAKLTQTDEFEGVPPSGQTVEVSGVGVFRLSDGKIIERWDYESSYGMEQPRDSLMTPWVPEAIAV